MSYKIENFIFEYEESKYYIEVEEFGVPIYTIHVRKLLTTSEFVDTCIRWYYEDYLLS